MQFVRITSDRPDFFAPINFNYGADSRTLNVVYGDVTKPDDKSRDSHNLGKTTLITVIDFLLLAAVDKAHLFQRHYDFFGDLTFYAELFLESGEFIGIRRRTANPNIIHLTKSEEPLGDLIDASNIEWQHPELSLTSARQLLDGWFGINAIGQYSFRKAITYFLRSQRDWDDELQLQKFSLGADRDWKPFVGLLFGFDQEILSEKYALDSEVERLRTEVGKLEMRTPFSESDVNALQAEITVLQEAAEQDAGKLNTFQFDEAEQKLITELVENIEVEISQINEEIYNATYDAKQIELSLDHKDKFDINTAESVFQEARIAFPGQLKKEYQALLEFRKKITAERKKGTEKAFK